MPMNGPSILISVYLVSAGIMLYSGVQSVLMSLMGYRPRLYLAFAICCFCAAGYQIFTAGYYQAESLAEAGAMLRGQGSMATLFLPAFYVCVALYTRQASFWPGFLLVAVLFGALTLGNWLSPYSLRFDTLAPAAPLHLPWDETLTRFSGHAGVWNFVEHLAADGVLLWALWRTMVQCGRGERRPALSMAICMSLILTSSLWGWLIDIGRLDSFYVAGFAFLGFAVLKSIGTAIELRSHTRCLEATGTRLHEEVERRRKIERVLRELRAGVSAQTGTAFFERLVERLAVYFGADYAFVGLIEGPGQDTVTTLAIWAQGRFADNLSYSLVHTPCAEVAGQCTRVYPEGVREHFPDDALAQAWGLESYVGTPLFDPAGRPLGIVVVAATRPLQDTDMVADALEIFAARASAEIRRLSAETERGVAEAAVRHSHALLQALTEIQRSFLLYGDTQITFERLLTPLLDLTGSQYGFIGEVLYDGSGQPYLKTHVYSKLPWDSELSQLYENTLANGLEFHNLHSLIGAVLESGEAVIANDAPNDPRRAGVPKGHPAIGSFLGLPVRQGNTLVGMIGIANREGGYDAGVVSYLEPFLNTCAALITAYRVGQAHRTLEVQLQHLAYHDSLTGLPNRALLLDRLTHQILPRARRYGHQVAVLFTDFDRFKTINDTLGHSVGDALLCETAERLRLLLREGDTVARIGGDEFLILLPRVLVAREVVQVATKLLDALSVPFSVLGYTLHLTTSVGISLYPQDGEDADALIKHADIALYAAKARGRNNYQMFDPGMNALAHQRLLIENALRWALLREEFVLYYQPRVNLATGRITGVEALIRWQHPERGLLPPGEFIAVAEEIGIIGEIGEWVLRVACRQAWLWQAEGLPPLRMAVNVSARQLHYGDFRQRVEQVLADTGLPASWLDLELTESSIMADPESAIAALAAVRGLGVQLAVDDFGTGYSSLAYLKRLPVDCLKIDRAFVAGIPDDSEDVAIAQTILAMARTLHLMVVAEGVETESQRDFLRAQGCDEGQGYLFSKPVPAESLAEILRRTAGMGADRQAVQSR